MTAVVLRRVGARQPGKGCDGGGCEGSRVRADYTIWRVSSLLFCTLSAARLRLRRRLEKEAEEAKNRKICVIFAKIRVFALYAEDKVCKVSRAIYRFL